ncbi:MAG TPA: glycosyltransferase [Verrucomicrobiae bacterium]|nr:glycosyltransferase [Verrucomicrobiae bacterium]
MIRILYLTQGMGVGGTEKQLLHLLRSLDRTRFAPTLAVFSADGVLRAAFEEAAVPIINLGFRQPLLQYRNRTGLLEFLKLLHAGQFSIVHSLLYHPNVLAAVCGRCAGIRHIVLSERNLGYFHKGFHRLVARVVYRLADSVTTNSNPAGKFLLECKMATPRKLVVIPNGIPLPPISGCPSAMAAARQTFGLPPTGPVVATLGRFAPIKGHAHFVAACAIVAQRFPNVTFALAGEGASRETLLKQTTALGLTSRIRFVGQVDDPAAFLVGLDAFVLPSLSEAMSNALMEAMAAARPIVATAVGGNVELIEHERTGLLVPPADPSALAEAICTLLGDPERGRCLGQAARAKIESYSIERMVTRTTELYERLLHSPV